MITILVILWIVFWKRAKRSSKLLEKKVTTEGISLRKTSYIRFVELTVKEIKDLSSIPNYKKKKK